MEKNTEIKALLSQNALCMGFRILQTHTNESWVILEIQRKTGKIKKKEKKTVVFMVSVASIKKKQATSVMQV
jgi:hypothetical protein